MKTNIMNLIKTGIAVCLLIICNLNADAQLGKKYGKASLLREGNKPFTFKEGKIRIDGTMVFTVENNKITAYEDVIKRYPFTSYSLQKKPAKNQLNGNVYQGIWTNIAKTFSVFTFRPDTYDEKAGAIYPFSGKYTLIAT